MIEEVEMPGNRCQGIKKSQILTWASAICNWLNSKKKNLLIVAFIVSAMPAWLFAQGFKSPGAGVVTAPSAP